jgi:Spy/CpxP family protein refolding chaperone
MFSNKRWLGRGLLLIALLPLALAGCHRGGHAELSEEQLRDRAEDAAEFIAKRADATDEQEQRIEQVLDALIPDLLALRPERQALADELKSALAADPVDPQRIEAVRQKGLALLDRASTRASQALVDSARVLDQKQRARLLEQWQRHRG